MTNGSFEVRWLFPKNYRISLLNCDWKSLTFNLSSILGTFRNVVWNRSLISSDYSINRSWKYSLMWLIDVLFLGVFSVVIWRFFPIARANWSFGFLKNVQFFSGQIEFGQLTLGAWEFIWACHHEITVWLTLGGGDWRIISKTLRSGSDKNVLVDASFSTMYWFVNFWNVGCQIWSVKFHWFSSWRWSIHLCFQFQLFWEVGCWPSRHYSVKRDVSDRFGQLISHPFGEIRLKHGGNKYVLPQLHGYFW